MEDTQLDHICWTDDTYCHECGGGTLADGESAIIKFIDTYADVFGYTREGK